MKTDVLIVGAGFAGAATAFHLTEQSNLSVTIIEKEDLPGFHASGRNASLLMQSAEIPEIRRLIIESRKAYETVGELAHDTNGSILLGTRQQLDRVREPENLPSEFWDPESLARDIPLLKGHRFEAALYTPSDAVIDIAKLLAYYLNIAQTRGTRLLLKCPLQKVSGKGPFSVRTKEGVIECGLLVNAAGAWAGRVGETAGAFQMPLTPFKRHLFVLGGVPPIEKHWPFVWNLDKHFYFRRESGDLLFSICDERPSEVLEPTVDDEIADELADLIWREMPSLHDCVQRNVWSCFRTKTPDASFVVGPDPELENFYWVAGLGGHGMGSSWEVGRLAAESILGGGKSPVAAFDPARFLNFRPAQHTPLES